MTQRVVTEPLRLELNLTSLGFPGGHGEGGPQSPGRVILLERFPAPIDPVDKQSHSLLPTGWPPHRFDDGGDVAGHGAVPAENGRGVAEVIEFRI